MHSAVLGGHSAVIQQLLVVGANTEATDKVGGREEVGVQTGRGITHLFALSLFALLSEVSRECLAF